MTDEKEKRQREPLLTMRPWLRRGATLVVFGLAVTHLLRPDWAIDAVFLGLLAFAVFIWLFDVESIEWQGIKAKRREINRAREAMEMAEITLEVPQPVIPVPSHHTPALAARGVAGSTSRAKLETIEQPRETIQRPPETIPPSSEAIHSKPDDLNVPTNPLERLIWAFEQIRIELIVLAGNSGRLRRTELWSSYHVSELIGYLRPTLSDGVIQAIQTVQRMRNEAVHAQVVDFASDLALEVLQNLRSIRRPYFRIRDPDVIVYRDQSLTTLHPFRGVMVVAVNDLGKAEQPGVYPRESDYVRGRFVTWSWNMERATEEEGWYLDPTTGHPKMAWGSAATFVGREYPDQWGLEYRLPRPDLGLD